VKLDAADFRQRYRAASDEELLAIDPDDLTDVARKCYFEELERRELKRGVVASAPEAEESDESDVDGEPVAVGSYPAPQDARAMRELLRGAGIRSYVENDLNIYANPLIGGYRVMVSPSDVERARDVLRDTEEAENYSVEPWSGKIEDRFVETNGIRIHYAEAGMGPLVILCHGFPECWYSWRHQLPALAEEGYHVVAPDLRGYGQTSRPEAVDAYDILQVVGDIVGLVNELGDTPAPVIVGHDWGAMVAWNAALLRPDLFRGVALLSVPFVPRRTINQTTWEQEKYPGKIFYQALFRSPAAEGLLGADVRRTLLNALYSGSGDARPEHRWHPVMDPCAVPTTSTAPPDLPPWLTEEDLDFVVGEFTRTGFTGGLNYYRNMDRNWVLTPFLAGAKLLHRAAFLAGAKDPVLDFLDEELHSLDVNVPNLWRKKLLPGAGHWIQQERPAEVNRFLISFLGAIEAGSRVQ